MRRIKRQQKHINCQFYDAVAGHCISVGVFLNLSAKTLLRRQQKWFQSEDVVLKKMSQNLCEATPQCRNMQLSSPTETPTAWLLTYRAAWSNTDSKLLPYEGVVDPLGNIKERFSIIRTGCRRKLNNFTRQTISIFLNHKTWNLSPKPNWSWLNTQTQSISVWSVQMLEIPLFKERPRTWAMTDMFLIKRTNTFLFFM